MRQASSLGSLLNGPMLETYPNFTRDLMACCVRVLALCDNSDLCFVGRSPENLFDFLSGLLIDSSWSQRVQLLQFSSSWEDRVSPHALAALHHYLEISRLDPWHLAHRAHPVAFVDLVNSGETMGMLVYFLSM